MKKINKKSVLEKLTARVRNKRGRFNGHVKSVIVHLTFPEDEGFPPGHEVSTSKTISITLSVSLALSSPVSPSKLSGTIESVDSPHPESD